MTELRPFFCFYGGKWRASNYYPPPEHNTIIEPFAGAAGYATRHHTHDVRLVDIDPIITGVWDYLIHVGSYEIMRLPPVVEHIDDVNAPQEARWLIGFWLNKGAAYPCKTPSKWMREHPKGFWGYTIRSRIAQQIQCIRHWRIYPRSYKICANIEATYLIDPPYKSEVGRHYRYSNVDYKHLAEWCRSRKGQVMVCEYEGATWLPFRPFMTLHSTGGTHGKGFTKEAIWIKGEKRF